MSFSFDPAAMRARFQALTSQREEILAQSLPLREQRDAYQQETERQIREVNGHIKQIEAGLYDIDVECAAIARALNGKTGTPPAQE